MALVVEIGSHPINQTNGSNSFYWLGFIHKRINHVSKIDAPTNNQKHQKKYDPSKEQQTANSKQVATRFNQYLSNDSNEPATLTSKQTPHMLPCTNLQKAWQDCFNVIEKKNVIS